MGHVSHNTVMLLLLLGGCSELFDGIVPVELTSLATAAAVDPSAEAEIVALLQWS